MRIVAILLLCVAFVVGVAVYVDATGARSPLRPATAEAVSPVTADSAATTARLPPRESTRQPPPAGAAALRTDIAAQDPPSSDCVSLDPAAAAELGSAFRDWRGQNGLAAERDSWPYQYYDKRLLEQLAGAGDPEAMFQLGMNYRREYLEALAADSDSRAAPVARGRDAEPGPHYYAKMYLMMAAEAGYAYAYVEKENFHRETLPHIVGELDVSPHSDLSPRALEYSAVTSAVYRALPDALYFDDTTTLDDLLAELDDDALRAEARATFERMLTLYRANRRASGLAGLENTVPPGIVSYRNRCEFTELHSQR
jgi:hypothetical protein